MIFQFKNGTVAKVSIAEYIGNLWDYTYAAWDRSLGDFVIYEKKS